MIFKQLREFLKSWRRPHQPASVEVKRQCHPGADYEDTMLAVTFAEAGVPEEALNLLTRRGSRKILVLGIEDTFSTAVMDYAALLAERLGYDLVALSVGAAWGKLSSPFGQHLREQFQRRAQQAAAALQEKAAEKNIPFAHVVKCGEVSEAVAEINKEYRRIELVITECPSRRQEFPARLNLPVFALKIHK